MSVSRAGKQALACRIPSDFVNRAFGLPFQNVRRRDNSVGV
jgi:hypothetical protein